MEIPKTGPDPSVPYQKMYVTLFNAVTTALDLIGEGELIKARTVLVRAQQETEELYIEGRDG